LNVHQILDGDRQPAEPARMVRLLPALPCGQPARMVARPVVAADRQCVDLAVHRLDAFGRGVDQVERLDLALLQLCHSLGGGQSDEVGLRHCCFSWTISIVRKPCAIRKRESSSDRRSPASISRSAYPRSSEGYRRSRYRRTASRCSSGSVATASQTSRRPRRRAWTWSSSERTTGRASAPMSSSCRNSTISLIRATST